MRAGVSRETDGAACEHDHSVAGDSVSRETGATTPSPHRNPLSRMLVFLLLAPIRVYQRFVSPALPPRCRYYPSCSAYAVQAVQELGPLKGTVLAVWRVLRCNPWSPGGLDPLENRRLFRSGNAEQAPAGPPKPV
jgi:putative membrane protein insertion efficiency factor